MYRLPEPTVPIKPSVEFKEVKKRPETKIVSEFDDVPLDPPKSTPRFNTPDENQDEWMGSFNNVEFARPRSVSATVPVIYPEEVERQPVT